MAYIEHVLPLQRLDRRSDRVEISDAQLLWASEEVKIRLLSSLFSPLCVCRFITAITGKTPVDARGKKDKDLEKKKNEEK